jgi:hypothetical protein
VLDLIKYNFTMELARERPQEQQMPIAMAPDSVKNSIPKPLDMEEMAQEENKNSSLVNSKIQSDEQDEDYCALDHLAGGAEELERASLMYQQRGEDAEQPEGVKSTL